MAYKHQLSLEVPNTNNCTIFRVQDTSIYSDKVPITCYQLEITSPGFNVPAVILIPNPPAVDEHFDLVLNACDLKIQSDDCDELSQVLPDGVYFIRYSVSPNDQVFVEYKHLRVCQILNKYYKELCKLELSACEPEADVKEQLKELRFIKSFIDAAKAKVEYCHDVKKGNELLAYANKRLSKYMSNDGCCQDCH